MCKSLHQGSNNSSSVISNPCFLGRNYNYTSSYPSWPNTNSIYDDSETISFAYPSLKPNQTASSLPRFRRQQSCHIDFSFSNETSKNQTLEPPSLDSLKGVDDKEVKITLALGNSTYASAPTSEKFALDSGLVNIIQENVPWQFETIPLILEAINQDKFVLIQGNDLVGKRRIAVGVAKCMLGSSDLLFRMSMRDNTNTVAQNCEMLDKALRENKNLVILVEDVDYADHEFAKFLETARRRDKDTGNAIFILTTDGETSSNKPNKKVDSAIQMKLVVDKSTKTPILDQQKRKADWELPIRSRSKRNNEMEEVSSDYSTKRDYTRQTSSSILDLNLEADVEELKLDKPEEAPGFSIQQRSSSIRFLEKIKNRFVLNRNSDQEERARDMFLSKLKRCFQGSGNTSSFDVEEIVLDGIVQGSGLYVNSLFEQWLKEVFQTSLQAVDSGEGERISIRLCLGDESCPEDGFMGTSLPKHISVLSLTG